MLVNDEYLTTQDETHILHPSSRALFRFWEKARAENAAPRREDLELKRIVGLVPYLFIAEATPAAGTFRWRLAGSMLCQLFRRELAGRSVLEHWDSFEAETIARLLTGTVERAQPCVLRFRFETDSREVIGAELAGFPLVASTGSTLQIFGGLFPFRDIARLDYSALRRFELAGARTVWTENLPASEPPAASFPTFARPFQVIAGGRR
jgi:hypothetical protein